MDGGRADPRLEDFPTINAMQLFEELRIQFSGQFSAPAAAAATSLCYGFRKLKVLREVSRREARRPAAVFMHNKRLMYTVRVGAPDPRLANLILEQFGGPDGELAAAMRYFTQGLAEVDPGRKDLLLDIATEELRHLEVVGSVVTMLNQGVKGQMAEGLETAELLANISGGTDSHTTALLYGGGGGLTNSAGVPWTAAYVELPYRTHR